MAVSGSNAFGARPERATAHTAAVLTYDDPKFGKRRGERVTVSREALQWIRERAAREPGFRERLRSAPLAALREYDLTDEECRRVVLPNFGWLVEGRLAGVSRPRTYDAFATLSALGVKALLSLSEDPLPAGSLTHFDLRAAHLPLADYTAPTIAQVERAMAVIDGYMGRGLPVAVHCAAGLGRTGTMLACYLVRQGTPAAAAIAEVRARRPGSIETAEQEAVIAAYERHLASARARPPAHPLDH